MHRYARSLPLLSLLVLSLLLSGCDPKCWPLCSSSSSGASSSTTTSTTTSTTDTSSTEDSCSDSTATITALSIWNPRGGESFEGSGPISIRWTKDGAGAVCVDLYKSGVFHYRIADKNDGYKQTATGMNWKPHSSLPDSTEYQIKLISPNDSTVNAISDYYFTITQ